MIRIPTRHRRIFRIMLRVLCVGGVVVLLAIFLLAQRKPQWYTPVRISSDDLPGLRRELTLNLDEISRKMVERKPFTVTWSEKQLTERLAAFRDLWPESRSAWPAELFDPVVKIDGDSILIGAFFERAGWRAVVGLRFALGVVSDSAQSTGASAVRTTGTSYVRLMLVDATAGSLSAPQWLLRRWFASYLDRVGDFESYVPTESNSHSHPAADMTSNVPIYRHSQEAWTIDKLFEGMLFENNFTWPNGKRPFRISEITTEPGTITLHIKPN